VPIEQRHCRDAVTQLVSCVCRNDRKPAPVCISLKRLRSEGDFRGCSHFFTFRPPVLLATLVAPTSAVSCGADGDFYVRARHALLPPHAPDMLAVRNRQLTARGLSPRQTRSLVGRSALSSPTTCRFIPAHPDKNQAARFLRSPAGCFWCSRPVANRSHGITYIEKSSLLVPPTLR
jgi:hypothetical protein